MAKPRILAFSGSARRASHNQRLATYAAGLLETAGADVTLINLRDHPLPLYNGDEEAESGAPTGLAELKDQFESHDGLLIVCPEYNSSITPLLKNTIDWLSRQLDDDTPMRAFRGKTAALMSASPGALGGLRGLVHVRAILGNIGVLVMPDQLAVAGAASAFGEDGELVDENYRKRAEAIARNLVDTLTKLA